MMLEIPLDGVLYSRIESLPGNPSEFEANFRDVDCIPTIMPWAIGNILN
jgi:hypothetical protein